MESGFSNLIEYISMQLSPENISDIINSALQGSVKKYIDDYVAREVRNQIIKTLSNELELIKNQVSIFLTESRKILELNLEFVKKFGNNQKFSVIETPSRDEILESFQMKRFDEGFQKFLQLQDTMHQDYYLSTFSLDELHEKNLSQSNAVNLALWAISKKNKELVVKMVSIIQKGDGLSTVLRKIVSANDPNFVEIRNTIIKKNL